MVKRATTDVLRNSDLNPHGCGGLRQKNRFLEDELSNPGALKIMQDMALVMERSPEAFKSMDEEALRQHFLVQLNAQFEGKATGETFNMGGKTDILLREADRNAFIAECKFWKGPKGFGEAIDQLLGYASWRDSKT